MNESLRETTKPAPPTFRARDVACATTMVVLAAGRGHAELAWRWHRLVCVLASLVECPAGRERMTAQQVALCESAAVEAEGDGYPNVAAHWRERGLRIAAYVTHVATYVAPAAEPAEREEHPT